MKKNSENSMEGPSTEKSDESTESKSNGTISNQEDVEKGDFNKFAISKKTIKKLKDVGINHLFKVQYDTFNHVHGGKDCIVQARTGSGKTLAFALPILERLREQEDEICVKHGRPPIALCLAPTRELAVQIHKEFEKFKSRKMAVSCFYGGAPYWQQEDDMRTGIDILVGTPGRILDFLEKDKLDCSALKHVILDEADRMLDMGFQESIDAILEKAYTKDNQPQTLLFSATVPSWVKNTAKKYSKDMKQIDFIGTVNKSSVTVEHKAIKCSYHERPATIKDVMQVYSGKYGKIIIFTSTKAEANELALNSVINMDSQVLHGDIQQKQREITLEGFRNGKFNCLIATDVASRGLDIPEIDLVIQTEPPKDIDSYIHRAGRTGRAGRKGICIIFYKQGQEYGVQAVERKAGIKFSRIGAPQQSDLIRSSAEDAIRAIDEVNEGVLDYFIPSAKELIESRGAEQALAAALAFISGTTEITSRSMLTSQTGFTTYICKQNWELRSTGLIWQTLKRHLDESVTSSFRGMRMCKDKKGCVFDVPTDKIKKLEEQWKGDKHATLEQLTELPELAEGVTNNPAAGGQGSSRDGGYGNRSGGFGNRGGGGGYNNSGGYGGGGGGYGGRNNNSWGNNDRGDRNNNFNNNRNNNWNDRNGNNNNNDYNNRNNNNFGGGSSNRGGKRPLPLMNGNGNEPDFVRAKKQKTW
jgi:ATP-dependent RNA helicase DDX21